VFIFYSEPNEPLPPDAKPGAGIHHPRFGFFLKERMDKLGIECQVRLREEYGGDRASRAPDVPPASRRYHTATASH
jgi:hypothetical protein